MATSYHRLLCYNTIVEKDDGALSRRLLLLFLKHKEEGDGSLLLSPSLFQQHHKRR
jgi:hypothetical protein